MNQLANYGSSSDSEIELPSNRSPLKIVKSSPKRTSPILPDTQLTISDINTNAVSETAVKVKSPKLSPKRSPKRNHDGLGHPTRSPKRTSSEIIQQPKSDLYNILFKKGLIPNDPLPVVTAKVDETLDNRISTFLELKQQGKHFNEQLMGNHTFRNPMIMSKMVEFMNLDPTKSKLILLKPRLNIQEPVPKKQRTEKSGLYDHFTKAKGPQPKGRKRRI